MPWAAVIVVLVVGGLVGLALLKNRPILATMAVIVAGIAGHFVGGWWMWVTLVTLILGLISLVGFVVSTKTPAGPRKDGLVQATVVVVVLGILLAGVATIVAAARDGNEADAGTPGGGGEQAGQCDPRKVVSNILISAGFTTDQFTVGEDNFDLTLPAVYDAGDGRFNDEVYTTAVEYTQWLGGGSGGANALLEVVMSTGGATREQALDPNNWVGFQLLTESEWSGNTLYKDGTVQPAGATRKSDVGDLGFVFVHPDDCRTQQVIRTVIVRVACGNPQTVPPNPPGKPAPTTTTTSPPGTTVPTTVPSTTTTTAPPGTTTTTTTQPTTTTTVVDVTGKCKLADGSLVPGHDPDGDGFCGSGGTDPTHPQFPDVQSEPISDPSLNDPTSGHDSGDAEDNSAGQDDTANNPPYTPDPHATPSPSPSGNPGQTETPTGPVNGGDSGVTDPDDSPGHQEDPVNTTPVGSPGGSTPPGGLTPP